MTISKGRLVSGPMYVHARLILRCVAHSRPERILELGGGYGAAARLWMTNSIHRPKLYVDVDLPESLFFAENYLGLHFGADSLVYLHGAEDFEQLSRPQVRFVLCPTHSIRWLSDLKFDLAWNSHSMSEMSADYVDYYMQWLDQNCPDYFYSCNSFGYDLTRMGESVNFISPLPPRRWKMVYSRLRGTSPAFTAEMMMRVVADREDRAPEVQDLLHRRLTPQSYLTLVDAARSIENGAMIWEIIQKVALEWDYLPKEIVHLCRLVDRLGASPSPVFDAFRERVERIAARSPRGRISQHLLDDVVGGESQIADVPAGMLDAGTDGARATIGGRVYHISPDYFGAVERLARRSEAIVAQGWAADTTQRQPVTTICGFAGDGLVAMGQPTFDRADIVEGFGAWSRKAGFRLRMPVTDRPLTFVGLTASGRAGRLTL